MVTSGVLCCHDGCQGSAVTTEMVLWPMPWKGRVVPWRPVLATRWVWTPRDGGRETKLTRGEILRWRVFLSERCTRNVARQRYLVTQCRVWECAPHAGFTASVESKRSTGKARVMCWRDEVERDPDYNAATDERRSAHDEVGPDAPVSRFQIQWEAPNFNEHEATRAFDWPLPFLDKLNFGVLNVLEMECHKISSALPVTSGVFNDLWGVLGHFSHSPSAESIQDDGFFERHVPDDNKIAGTLPKVWFFSVLDPPSMAKSYTRCLTFHGKQNPRESVCVFFPRPAARLALKAWAESKPAHLKRVTGGCLSCLENVPIRIGNEDLFHCVTIPGTTRQLVGCSSYKSVELHVRNITSARIALATRGLVGQIKNIPCSGAWLLELLKPPPKMRSLMEEPPQDAAAVGSAFVGGGEGNISVGSAAGNNGNFSVDAAEIENDHNGQEGVGVGLGSVTLSNSVFLGGGDGSFSVGLAPGNNENFSVDSAEIENDHNGQEDFDMGLGGGDGNFSVVSAGGDCGGNFSVGSAGVENDHNGHAGFDVGLGSGALGNGVFLGGGDGNFPGGSSVGAARNNLEGGRLDWAPVIEVALAGAALLPEGRGWAFSSPAIANGKRVRARFLPEKFALTHGPNCGPHVPSRTGIKVPNLDPPPASSTKAAMTAHVKKLIKARLKEVFKGVEFKGGGSAGGRSSSFCCKKCLVFELRYETILD